MATWRPDPSFYPSPRMAMQAPAEKLAYVAAFDPDRQQPDAHRRRSTSTRPRRPTARSSARSTMPNAGDELHHFGWNACSSCLCPNAPHPHVERRYLVVPGLRSSRIHILDTKPDPKNPKIVKVIEAEEIASKAGYSRPHTVHCGPEGIYVSALGNAEGKAPGGIFLIDHESFDVLGRWEIDRGPQELAYDFWWHLGHDTMVTSEWGTPDTFENGLVPEVLLAGKYGRHLHFWDLHKRKHQQAIDLGPEYQLVFELRPAHDPTKAYGFVGVRHQPEGPLLLDLDLVPRRRRLGGQEDHRHPGRARRPRPAAAAAQGLQGGAAAGHRHRPVDGRPLPLRLLLGHRRHAPVRRLRPVRARSSPARCGSAASSPAPRTRRSRAGRSTAGRRWSRSAATASGSTSPTRSTAPSTPSSTPRAWTAGWSSSTSAPTAGSPSTRSSSSTGRKGHLPHQVRLEGGDCSSDSYCYP